MNEFYDAIIIGGGIIGASTAMQYQEQNPDKSVLLVEKESACAQHQTGHNSGVIHAGVYYAPGSLKAEFCKRGLTAMIGFCREHSIPFDQCGKIIVATNEKELERLDVLYQNCLDNGLNVKTLDQVHLSEIEPNIDGIKGVLVGDSAITDYTAITEKMISIFKEQGGSVRFGSTVSSIAEKSDKVIVGFKNNEYVDAAYLVACAGLQADRIAKMTGISTDFRIVPFKGEYFKLPREKSNIVKHLIYPVPDPEMPFLGVHLTRMIDGSLTVGPNAVLSLEREGYDKLNFSLRDLLDMAMFSGFWKVVASNIKSGIGEITNSLWKPGYLKLVQRYCPSIFLSDLEPFPPGVRAQAVMKDGTLVHDFLFMNTDRTLHVCNAPSPAATSAIPIGEHIVNKIAQARK